jgi:hypothetical protein
VGVLNKDKFPYTTNLVFGTLGYDITFSLEHADFTPSAAPMEDHNMGSGDGQGENHRDKDDKDQSKMKKQKMSEKYHDEHNADSLVPMQLALTPFPPNVDVAKKLQAKKTKETSLELAVMERKHFQFLYKRRLVTPADSSKVGIDDRNQDDTPSNKSHWPQCSKIYRLHQKIWTELVQRSYVPLSCAPLLCSNLS